MGEGEIGIRNLNGGLKSVLLLLCIISAIVPCVLGFVNLDSRLDTNEKVIESHEEKLDSMVDKVHSLELNDAVSEAHYQNILTEVAEIKAILARFKVVD